MDTTKLLKLIRAYLSDWRDAAADAEQLIAARLSAGDNIEKAVDSAIKKYPDLFFLNDLPELLADAAAIGLGIADPDFITAEQRGLLIKAVEKPWTADGVKLSARLHAAGRDMRAQILTIVGRSLKNGSDWRTAAKALYDGYGAAK